MPRRALQTWQMRLLWRLRSLIFCSSQKPISRRRWVTSGEADKLLDAHRHARVDTAQRAQKRLGTMSIPIARLRLRLRNRLLHALNLGQMRLSCKSDLGAPFIPRIIS